MLGVTRNLCYLSKLSLMEMDVPSKMKMNLEEDSVRNGETFSRHAKKARGITSTKIFCDLFKKLPMTYVGLLIRLSLIDFLALKKDSAPGNDGIPYGAHRCASGLGSKLLLFAFDAVLERVFNF